LTHINATITFCRLDGARSFAADVYLRKPSMIVMAHIATILANLLVLFALLSLSRGAVPVPRKVRIAARQQQRR
jgi:hypothetical protein